MKKRLYRRAAVAPSAMAAVLSLTFQAPSIAQAAGPEIEANFVKPGDDARPWLRWWWPGADVEPAEIDRELELIRDSGFGGAEIQPFNPGILNISRDASARMHRYATPPFFDLMKHAADAASARGLALDYTFGSAWPTGGGFAITPELALRELTMARTEIEGGAKGPVKVELPLRSRKMGAFNSLDPRSRDPRVVAIKKQFDSIGRVVAVVAFKGTAPELQPAPKGAFAIFPWLDVAKTGELDPRSEIVLTDRLKADGTLNWTPPQGRWQVFVFKEYAANTGLFAGVGEGPQLVADHFDKRAFDAHAARVGDPLAAALGPHPKGLRGSFIDSLELMPDIYWSRDFLAEFRKRRGYDLTPYLPFVLQPGWMQAWNDHYSRPYFESGGIGDRIRADYRLTVSDLLVNRFIQPFVEWNHNRGLLARFQAHGAPVDTLKGYGLADIPETEDLPDGGNPYFMRLARSAGRLYGRSIISAESLCWSGRPYSVTLGEMRQRADLILASGVNQMVFHGMPYAYQREQWPGWHAFGPIAFSTGFSSMLTDTNPLWPGVPRLTSYVTRMQTLMRQGTSVVPVALYLNEIGYYDGIETGGEKHNPIERALLSSGYDYDRINADSLLQARVVDRELLTAAGAKFPALVLPPVDALRAEVAERIAAFARAGLPVFFIDKAPSRELGFLDHRTRDGRVAAAVTQVMASGGQLVSRAALGERLYASKVPANLRFTANGADIIFVQRAIEGRTVTFLHNNAKERRDASFDIAAKGRLTRWDAMTGKIAPYASSPSANGTHVPLSLHPGESALLVTDPSGAPEQPTPQQAVGEKPLPSSSWTLSAKGHGIGGTPVAYDLKLPALTDFANIENLSRFSGLATYRTSFRVDAAWRKPGTRLILDLGKVHDMATVSVNGRALPVLIGPDWTADITDLIKGSAANQLEITVANVPNNAMIDPKKPGFKDIKPVPGGLIGPVVLKAVR